MKNKFKEFCRYYLVKYEKNNFIYSPIDIIYENTFENL